MWEADRQLDIVAKEAQKQVLQRVIWRLNDLKRESEWTTDFYKRQADLMTTDYGKAYCKGGADSSESMIKSIQAHIDAFESLKNEISAQLEALNGDFEEAV